MRPFHTDVARTLDFIGGPLADSIVDRLYRAHPEYMRRYGEQGRVKCREDALLHLKFLSQSLASARPAIFSNYVQWARVMLESRGTPIAEWAEHLQIIVDTLSDCLVPDDAAAACEHIVIAMSEMHLLVERPPSPNFEKQKLEPFARTFLNALLAGRRREAVDMIWNAVHCGTPVRDIYTQVLQPSQREVGRLWQTAKITVAQEHYCTGVTQSLMSALPPDIAARQISGRRFVGACPAGELHDMGIRMVTDFFQMDGWDAYFVGASVPGGSLISMLRDMHADVVGLSATLAPHVSTIARFIEELRGIPDCRNMKVIVGGHPFELLPDLWQNIHADGSSATAEGAVALANNLAAPTMPIPRASHP